MVCKPCVEKLASRLVKNHKNLNWKKAVELAERGVERVEKRTLIKPGNPSDYTLDCEGSSGGGAYCGGQECYLRPTPPACRVLTSCNGTCICPEPLPNSHQVEDNCACGNCCGNYPPDACPDGCNCPCSGTCGYDCDEGFVWSGITCVLIVSFVGKGKLADKGYRGVLKEA